MTPLTAQRTLVKSSPELWSELSEVDRLARHLEAFGEIKITKLEPEHTVAWEGEHACGTVSIEPSGWGTKVTLEAALALEPQPEPEPVVVEPVPAEPEPEPEPEPVAVEPEPLVEPEPVVAEPEPPDTHEPEPASRKGFWARLFGRWLLPEERVNQLVREPEEQLPVLETADPPLPEAEPPLPGPEPEPPAPPEPEPAPPEPATTIAADVAQAVLDNTLDTLGAAHHRPFSRG